MEGREVLELIEADPRTWPASILPEEGNLLGRLVEWKKPNFAVEIGRMHGYSTIWIAQSMLKGSKLLTLSPDVYDDASIAREYINKAPLPPEITIANGWSYADLPPLIENQTIDFAFIDGNHEADVAWSDVQMVHQNLRVGGMIVIHDLWPCEGHTTLEDWHHTVGKMDIFAPTGPAVVRMLLETSSLYDVTTKKTGKGMVVAVKTDDGILRPTPGKVWEAMGSPKLELRHGSPPVPWRVA